MKFRHFLAVLSIVAASIAWTRPAPAEERLALVIGNSAYEVQPLANPANDAALLTQSLRQVGFKVTHLEDLDQRAQERALVQFSRDLRAAGEDAVGLFYYAGHAVQSDGENYLIPVDAKLQDKLDLRIQTLDASTVMASLKSAGNRLNMVFLDACRNNPFKGLSRSTGRGLAKLDAPSGTLVAYSTAPGDVAADGTGRNSPYSRALAKAITEPGLPVEQALKRVRIDVMEHTGNRQVPWESSSLIGDFYFVPELPEPEPEPEPVPDPVTEPVKAGPDPEQREVLYWESVKNSKSPAAFDSYLTRYPDGLFADIARIRVDELKRSANAASKREQELVLFQSAQQQDTRSSYRAYLDSYPDGTFATMARLRLEELVEKTEEPPPEQKEPTPAIDEELLLWESVKNGRTAAEYQAYLDRYPNGRFAGVARAKIDALDKVASLPPPSNASPHDGEWAIKINGTKIRNGHGTGRTPMCVSGASPTPVGTGTLRIRGGEGETTIIGNDRSKIDVVAFVFDNELQLELFWRNRTIATFSDDLADGVARGTARNRPCDISYEMQRPGN